MILLLKSLFDVVQDVQAEHEQGHLPYQIETIRKAILRSVGAERMEIIEFDSPENPVLGKFVRYEMAPAPYALPETKIDIFYSQELNHCWRRFVVCKEMCHALENDEEMRVHTIDDLDRLIQALTLPSGASETLASFPPFSAEKFAEFAALELLCPLRDRRALIRNGGRDTMSDLQIATLFRVPVQFIDLLFDPKYMAAVESTFTLVRKG